MHEVRVNFNSLFLSTTLIQQNEVVLEQSEQNILTQKITTNTTLPTIFYDAHFIKF